MLQQEYWIIGLVNALRKIKSSCIKCRHRNAHPIQSPMADLPRERLDEHAFPFTHNGVDHFGPLEVKFLRGTLKRWCCLVTCLTTRAVHIEVTQSLDTESCLAYVTRFIARPGYLKTIISDNGTNFVGAVNGLKASMNEWDKDKIESDLAQKKNFLESQSSRSSSLWWDLGKTCSKLQESHDWKKEASRTRCSAQQCVLWNKHSTQDPDSSKWRPWRLDSAHTKSFLARRKERECTIHAIHWTPPEPEKIIQNGSSIYRHDPENMDSWISSTMELEIKLVKRTCAKPERRWVSVASRWLCKTLWIQSATNHWDLPWQRRSCEISKSQNGTWRAKPTSREVSASILRWCFRDRKQGRRCYSYKNHQRGRNCLKLKNLEFVKTQKWSKLKYFKSWDRKSVHPPIFGRQNLINPRLWQTVGVTSKLLMDPTNFFEPEPQV